jgi:hypothetical protein
MVNPAAQGVTPWWHTWFRTNDSCEQESTMENVAGKQHEMAYERWLL